MTRPIGGALGLDSALLHDLPERAAPPAGRSITSGRTGLRLIARTLEGPVLLPSYLCASLVQPFREEQVPVGFYRVRSDLSVDVDDLLVRARSAEAVVVVAYFGFPVQPELAELRDAAVVVEDCVHGSLLEFPEPTVGALGDFVVTAYRKYLPLPDGGVVSGAGAARLPELPPARQGHVLARALGRVLRGSFPDGASDEIERAWVALEYEGERSLDEESPLAATSKLSSRLLARIDLPAIAAARRANYAVLLDALADDDVCRPLLPDLPERVSPLVLPVVVDPERRDRLRSALHSLRVFAPVHWPLPPEVDADEFTESADLSRSILGLPVDQRYDGDDMLELVARLHAAYDLAA